MNQQETYDYVLHFLKIFYNQEKIKHNGKYIIAEGTIPICLIAHLDTVFEHTKKDLITKNIIITTNNVILHLRFSEYDNRLLQTIFQ